MNSLKGNNQNAFNVLLNYIFIKISKNKVKLCTNIQKTEHTNKKFIPP